jgi:NADH-quinone oxidoreductase subunit N
MAGKLLYGLLPEHLLLGLLFALMLLEMFKPRPRVGGRLVTVVLFAAVAVLVRQYAVGYEVELLPGEIHIDRFALLAKLVVIGSGLLWTMMFPSQLDFKSAFLLCSSLFGASIVMDSAGFISLVLGIEMLSLPAFALLVHLGGASGSEGAFKYLLLSAVASALLMFGIAFSYGATGLLSIDAFAHIASGESALGAAATVLIASAFFVKAAVFPFHGWAPDAYSAARIHVTAFLAAIVKGAVILAFVRILPGVALGAETVAIITALSIGSILFGNAAAIRQHKFKRLLAYSSIAHAGYMMFAFVDVTGGRATDLLWYVIIYALTVIVACASFSRLCPGEQDDVQALDGTFQSRPIAALIFGLAMLSLAGLPPLPGFFAKLFVFRSVIASGHLVPAIIAFTGSFIGVTYYLGLFYRLFTASTQPTGADPNREAAR